MDLVNKNRSDNCAATFDAEKGYSLTFDWKIEGEGSVKVDLYNHKTPIS